jgi:hypothetical protein
MMHRSFRRSPTAEERRVVRKWTYGVAVVYGACALILFGVASLSQHLAGGSKEPAVTAATANRHQLSR